MSDEKWEQWWSRGTAHFRWFRNEPEPELVELVEGSDLPPGGAVDIGCGNGHITSFLAQHFDVAVGLDVALTPLTQARDEARADAVFLVSDARAVPLATGRAAFVLDRGCMHCLPREDVEEYLGEVARLLAPNGRFFVVARNRWHTAPRVRDRPRQFVGYVLRHRRGPMRRLMDSRRELMKVFPGSLEVERVSRVRVDADSGWRLRHVLIQARRRDG